MDKTRQSRVPGCLRHVALCAAAVAFGCGQPANSDTRGERDTSDDSAERSEPDDSGTDSSRDRDDAGAPGADGGSGARIDDAARGGNDGAAADDGDGDDDAADDRDDDDDDRDGGGRSDTGVAAEDAASPLSELPLGARSMFPRPGATGTCNDPPLRIEFGAPPTLGSRGRVQVWAEDQPARPVATIDLGGGAQDVTRDGQQYKQLPAAHLDGNAAVFALAPGALARGKGYYVTIDDGVLRGPEGSFAIDDATSWRFETAAADPSDLTRLVVGLDGRAPFCTVQGAIDAVAARNQTPTQVEIGEGSYFGLVHWAGKNKITLRGSDREKTRIVGTNNNSLNPSTRTRSLFGVDASSDIVIENLTIHNLTPQGGSQAEALALLGCDRCVVRDANIKSLQDTLLWSGRIYAERCYVEGNVDFIWGSGAAFFKSCEIKTVGRGGYVVQSRNDASGYGYVFVDSKFTSGPGMTASVFARIDASAYPASHVAIIDCEVGPHITAAAWTVTNARPSSSPRFWEYGSKGASGRPLSTSGRSPYSRQLSASEAARMRDPAQVLGGFEP